MNIFSLFVSLFLGTQIAFCLDANAKTWHVNAFITRVGLVSASRSLEFGILTCLVRFVKREKPVTGTGGKGGEKIDTLLSIL